MIKKRKRSAPTKATKAPQSKASRAQAVDVLRKHAERLRKSGAHAMSIKPGAQGQGHVIEVYVPEDFTGTLPSKVGATVNGRRVDLPIKPKKAPRFKPEKL